jgi:excisionase family DNA binding protein
MEVYANTYIMETPFVEEPNANLLRVNMQNIIPAKIPQRRRLGELVTVKEASEKTKIKISTLRNWARDGKIEATKVGGIWLIDWDSLRDFIEVDF